MSINADGYGLNEALVSAIEQIVNAVAPGSSGVSSVGGVSGVVPLRTINGTNLAVAGADIPLVPTSRTIGGRALSSNVSLRTVAGHDLTDGGGDIPSGGGGGGSAPDAISYATAIPLDSISGHTMAEHYLTANDTMTIDSSPAPTDGGFVTGVWISDGTHAPVQPASAVSAGGVFSNIVGKWNAFTYARIGILDYLQIVVGPTSPIIDQVYVADGDVTHIVVQFLANLDQTGSAAGLFSSFTVSGGAHTPTASAWGTSKQIILTVPTFVAGVHLTLTLDNTPHVLFGVGGIAYAFEFTNFAIDNRIVDLGNFRWLTLTGDVAETGSGPYTYSMNGTSDARMVLGTLKMPAGVACTIVLTKTVLDTPSADNEYCKFMFALDNTTPDTANPDILGIGGAGAFTYQTWTSGAGAVDTGVVLDVASKMRLRKDTSNNLFVDTWPTGGSSFTQQATVAGSAVDYFIQGAFSTAGNGTEAYQVESQTGMVPA